MPPELPIPGASTQEAEPTAPTDSQTNQKNSNQMTEQKSSAPRAQISGARVVPLHLETAHQFGGGSKGRTLALIYRQLLYWSKYSKWTGKNGKRFFYKSADELSQETTFSTKTIYRAIKHLQELGLIIVEKIHKRYWKQVNFYHLPHSPFTGTYSPARRAATSTPRTPARAEAVVVSTAPVAPTPSAPTTTPAPAVHPAAVVAAKSIKTREPNGFGHRVPISNSLDYKSKKLQSIQDVVQRCFDIAERMKAKKEQEMMV